MKGVDISNYQAGLDLTKAKSGGIEFAICKLSEGRTYRDMQFDTFYSQAKSCGLPIGAYVYSHATTISAAIVEAQYALQLLNGRKLELGIYLDVETEAQMEIPANQLKDTVRAFCKTVEAAGYLSGIYGSEYNLWTRMKPDDFPMSVSWVAHYGKQPAFACDIWQNGDSGRFPGYSGPVDTDNVMSERFIALVNGDAKDETSDGASNDEQTYTPPIKDPVSATFPPDPSVFILQMVLQYNGYWDSRPDGHKSQAFFDACAKFIADMQNC